MRTKLTDVREEDDSGNLLRRAAPLTSLQKKLLHSLGACGENHNAQKLLLTPVDMCDEYLVNNPFGTQPGGRANKRKTKRPSSAAATKS